VLGLVLAAVVFSTGSGLADERKPLKDVPLMRVGAGYFDVLDRDNGAGELNLEYVGSSVYKAARPIVGASVTSDKATYLYAGVAFDFGKNGYYFMPSFAPGYYSKGDGKDLGHHLEIRTQVEVGYEFDDASRLGLSLSHRSNASIGKTNPGTESLTVHYSIPMDRLFR
jgi:lipid A 3-O-deacylase